MSRGVKSPRSAFGRDDTGEPERVIFLMRAQRPWSLDYNCNPSIRTDFNFNTEEFVAVEMQEVAMLRLVFQKSIYEIMED